MIRLMPCRDESPRVIERLPEPISSIWAAPNDRLLVRTRAGELAVVEVPTCRTTLVLGGANDYLYDWESRIIRQLRGRLVGGDYSPDGRHVQTSDDTGMKVINLLTGDIEAKGVWTSRPAKGYPAPDFWLNDREVLLVGDLIGGPVILNVDGRVVRVAKELFGLDCSERSCEVLAALSVDRVSYHLLLQAPGETPEAEGPWWLYHS